jgi:glycosyltransferase involved in cell wall biosynthesis
MQEPRSIPVTVLVATKNEEVNLGRCLASLSPAKRVVVLDSGSVDRTATVARNAGAEVVQFNYGGGYPKKRQWAFETVTIVTPWILLVDADEVVPEKLWEEIRSAIASAGAPSAFLVTKGFHFMGRKFSFGGFSHSAVILMRRGAGRFERLVDVPACGLDMEVHERLIVEGAIGALRTPLIHEDFKGLHAYMDRHNRYSTWEAALRHRFLTTGCYGEQAVSARILGNVQERRRFMKQVALRVPCEAWLWFVYHYLFRLGFLEGRAGWIASRLRQAYIEQVRFKIFERKMH